jgi:type IV pilus assembly protein PilV
MQAMKRIGHSIGKGPSRGFTLIEVLIALVIFAIGLLGVAALYLDTLRGSRSALFRQQAIALSADLADRIRTTTRPGCTPVPPATNCGLAVADPDWKDAVAAQLPGGTFEVKQEPVGPLPAAGFAQLQRYSITISWIEAGQDAPSTYTLEFDT